MKQLTYPSLSLKNMLFVAAAAFILLVLMPNPAWAQSLPWETGTCKMAKAFTGPWLGWVAVIAIVVAAIAFGVGELNGPMKQAMTIVAGVSIAISAVTVVTWFWPGIITSSAC